MTGFPQLRTLAHDDRHNVAVDDVARKYTNNEANKAFDDSVATLMQKWAWQKSAEAEQFFRWKRLCIDVELSLKTSFSSPDTLYKMPTNKRRVEIA